MAALPRTYIFGIIIFTMIIIGGVTMISNMSETSTTFVNTGEFNKFNSSFNKLNDVTSQVGSLENKVTNSSIDVGTFGVLNSLIQTTWQGIKLITINFDFMSETYNALDDTFDIPKWVISLIILLITVMIIFSVIGAILQWYL